MGVPPMIRRRHMLRHLTPLCVAIALAAAATTFAADKPAAAPSTAPTIPPQVQQLKGKTVKIYEEVNLLGRGTPSPLHTGYLTTLLQQAGATVVRGDLAAKPNEKQPDLVIFGHMPPPPRFSGD